MSATVTNQTAEVALPGQAQITIRTAHGEVELSQERVGEWHAIYVRTEHVLTLICAMLRVIGEEDAERALIDSYMPAASEPCHDIDFFDENDEPLRLVADQ
jgi:hypothetical protein